MYFVLPALPPLHSCPSLICWDKVGVLTEWPYFKVFFNPVWWKIRRMRRYSRIIRFCICGMCDPVLPFWICSHPHRKSSIKAMPFLPFLSPFPQLSLHSFWLTAAHFGTASFSIPLHPDLFALPSYFFQVTLCLGPALSLREPSTKTTSSHPIFTPLIRFKWHGREGQSGN